MPCLIDVHWRRPLSWMATTKEMGIGGRTGMAEGPGKGAWKVGGGSEAAAGM